MPRGRQYYDPIVQMPSTVQPSESLERIELFRVAENTRVEGGPVGKWVGRKIAADGSVAEVARGDFDHDRALAQAEELWPGLNVYELDSEYEDSTWQGVGPSPRLWQVSPPEAPPPMAPPALMVGEVPEVAASGTRGEQQLKLHVLPVSAPGMYVELGDVLALLYAWEQQYEAEKNPSAAMALREARETLATSVQGGNDG